MEKKSLTHPIESTQLGVPSRRYIVFANEFGSRAARISFKSPDEEDNMESSPSEYLSPIGIGYIHAHDVYGDRVVKNMVGIPLMDSKMYSELVGDLLDVVDAMFSDVDQRKALKKLIQSTVYRHEQLHETRIVQTLQTFKDED